MSSDNPYGWPPEIVELMSRPRVPMTKEEREFSAWLRSPEGRAETEAAIERGRHHRAMECDVCRAAAPDPWEK